MPRQRLLLFRDGSVAPAGIEASAQVRWAGWSGNGEYALLCGDRGLLMRYERGLARTVPVPTNENLRCVAVSPSGDEAYAVGNGGAVLRVRGGAPSLVDLGVRSNLRRVAWRPRGDCALVVGNGGEARALSGSEARRVEGAETNLRSVSWHPSGSHAVVAGNCLRPTTGGDVPSPNLFRFDGVSMRELHPAVESRADLLSASWSPDGGECLVVGFDQVWHTPAAFSVTPGGERRVPWDEVTVFPTACAWHPSGRYALVGTGGLSAGEGAGALYRYDGSGVEKAVDLGPFRVSCIAWAPGGDEALLAGSHTAKAFSV